MAKWIVEIEGVDFDSRSTEIITLEVEAGNESEAEAMGRLLVPKNWFGTWDKVYFKVRVNE